MRYAVIFEGIVENIIMWDGVTPFSLPNRLLVRSDTLSKDDVYDQE